MRMLRLGRRGPLLLLVALLLATILLVALQPSDRGSADFGLEAEIPPSGEPFALALRQAVRAELRPGHRVALVHNGRVFDVLEREIRAARSSVHVLLFIWREGRASDRLLAALAERAKAGVQCRVLVDAIGSNGFEERIGPSLRGAGCEPRVFNSPALGASRRSTGRNHRKIVVVDGRVGVVGGFGVQDEWLGDGRHPKAWRDVNARLEGPAVEELQLAFAENWLEAGGRLLPSEAFPPLPERGPARAAFVASTGTEGVSAAERMYIVAIAAARERLWVANAYFVPSAAIIERLIQKRRQGIDVRVLVPGELHDVKPVLWSQRATYRPLLEAGVRIWEYPVSLMHAKTLLVDEALVVVGSANLDPYSLEKLEEGSLVVEDGGLARQLEQSWEEDLRHAKEITLSSPEAEEMTLLKRAMRRLLWFAGES